MPRFRVVNRRDTSDGWIDTTLYTDAPTAAYARQKVASSHMKPQLSRIVSCTAIADAGGRAGVWSLDTVPPVNGCDRPLTAPVAR